MKFAADALRLRAALLAAALLWPASAAFAADAPPPDPAKMALAGQILEATHASANIGRMLDSMAPEVVADIRKNKPDISDQTLQLFTQAFKDEVAGEMPDLMKLEAEIYSDHFTLAELQYLQTFYASALGRKMVDETPAILSEMEPVSMAWGQHAGIVAMAKVALKLKEQGVDLNGAKK